MAYVALDQAIRGEEQIYSDEANRRGPIVEPRVLEIGSIENVRDSRSRHLAQPNIANQVGPGIMMILIVPLTSAESKNWMCSARFVDSNQKRKNLRRASCPAMRRESGRNVVP